MKKLFIIAAAACVTLASCVKNDPVANQAQGDPITFASPVVAPATKAQVKYDESVPFNVFAYYSTLNSYTGASTQTYINDKTVSCVGDVWSTNPVHYWPKNGTLTFVAYSPTSAVSGDPAPLKLNAGNSSTQLVLDYTVPTAAASQIDVLYSDWAIDQEKTDYVTLPDADPNILGGWTGVDIAFHHALTSVNFTIKGTTEAIAAFKIKGVTLGQLSNTETLTVPFNTNTPSWTKNATSKDTYTILAAAADAANATALTENGSTITKGFYLIPQKLDNVELVIDYYVISDAGWIPQQERIALTTAKVGGVALTEWNIGTKYNYTLQFTADAITFAPVVEADWALVDVDGSTI